MPTSNPDKIKQDSVPNVTIQVLEVKKKLTEPEIKGQTGYKKKKESYNTAAFFTARKKEPHFPVLQYPKTERCYYPNPAMNTILSQFHLSMSNAISLNTHLNLIVPLISCSTVCVSNYTLCNTRRVCFCIRTH
jgi:hypothetical protein